MKKNSNNLSRKDSPRPSRLTHIPRKSRETRCLIKVKDLKAFSKWVVRSLKHQRLLPAVHCASSPLGVQIPAPGRCAWTQEPPGRFGVGRPARSIFFGSKGDSPRDRGWGFDPLGSGVIPVSAQRTPTSSQPGRDRSKLCCEGQMTNDKSQQLAAWLGANGSPRGLQKALPPAHSFFLKFH